MNDIAIDPSGWLAAAEALQADTVALRRAIHAEPELGLETPKTLAKVKAALAGLPEVPTIAEAGLPGYEASAWYGLFAPAGTPRDIVARLNAEAVKALKRPDVRERLLALGGEPAGTTAEEFAAFIAAEIAKWAKLVQEVGIRIE